MKPETMILRFRDLSTAPGDTLRLHAEVIAERGYVWWGWWSKSGERVPPEVFGDILQRARAGGLAVFLFDSGREQLHRATLEGIQWDPGLQRSAAPEEGASTPGYYGGAGYLAWFKLTAVELEPVQDPVAVLQRLSYVEVPEFFEQRESSFGPFDGKRVASLGELRDQDRSIWFVRAARPEDSQHEIRLLHAHAFRPSHFPDQFHQSSSRSVLWLSDVHFSIDTHHAFPLEPTEVEKPLGDRVEQACTRFGINDLGGIVLSGDLAWKADPEEFAQARALVKRLQTWSRVENYQVAVCPGNHDVAFSADPAQKDMPVVRASEEATKAYAAFYSELFYLAPNAFLSCGRKLFLGGAVPVELVCLNSSLLSQAKDLFQGHGFVGEGQLEDAARQMGWTETESDTIPVRIVVVHHHLVPVIYREEPVAGRSYSTVLDAEALVRWLLRHRVKVVLHGHMHTPFHTVLERSIRFGEGEPRRIHVFGMGSSGVEQGHLSEEVPHNLFGVLRFSRETLTVTYYSVHPVNEPQKLKEYVVPLWE